MYLQLTFSTLGSERAGKLYKHRIRFIHKKNIYETFVPSIKTIESLCVKINNNFRSKIINDKLCGQFKNITIILQFNDI